jgi:hypothetical protein
MRDLTSYHPTNTLAGYDLTTDSSSLLGGRQRRHRYTTPPHRLGNCANVLFYTAYILIHHLCKHVIIIVRYFKNIERNFMPTSCQSRQIVLLTLTL